MEAKIGSEIPENKKIKKRCIKDQSTLFTLGQCIELHLGHFVRLESKPVMHF